MKTLTPLLILFILDTIHGEPVPYPMQWNTSHFFGPDGPWQAVPLRIGWPEQLINLYPGGAWSTILLTPDICDNISLCPAAEAGLYDPYGSDKIAPSTANHNLYNGTNNFTLDPSGAKAAMNLKGEIVSMTDRMTFDTQDGGLTISNVSIAAATSANFTMPDQSTHALQVGFLALGGKDNLQTFQSTTPDVPTYVANLLPGWLTMNGQTPSNSWGLHIGSVSSKIAGSLVFGGYDRSRVIGDVITSEMTETSGDLFVDLVDIGIGIDSGASPFASSSINGLLQSDSPGTAGTGKTRMQADPTVPYIYLPVNSCREIVKHLPVTYSSAIDLYLWQTNDPAFSRILSSPSFLSFIFQGTTSNVTIKVPFQLLNLTIEPPLVKTPQAYFPCKGFVPQTDGSTPVYQLGRAFLQAAFIGLSWTHSKWWLAQGPGPNSSPVSLQSIENSTTTISSLDAGNWTSSWSNAWTPIPDPTPNSTATTSASSHATTSSPSSSPTPSAPPQSSGMSAGAKAAVGVGVLALALGLVVAGVLLFRRRSKAHHVQAATYPKGSRLQGRDAAASGEKVSLERSAHPIIYEIGEAPARRTS